MLYKSFDELVKVYKGDFSLASISNFIESNSIPTLMQFDQKAAEVIFKSYRDAIFFLHGTDEDQNKQGSAEFQKASKYLKGKILMAETQLAEGYGKRVSEFLEVTP